MEEVEKKQMVTSDRASSFREVNSFPRKSGNSRSTIRKYLREVQGRNVTTSTGLERGEETSTAVYVENTKAERNSRSTYSNKLDHITQSLNMRNEVKVKKEMIDTAVKDSVWEIDDNTMDNSTDNELSIEDSDDSDFDSEKEATGELEEDIQELEKRLQKTIPSNRRPWETGGSREKIKKFYTDVVEYQQTTQGLNRSSYDGVLSKVTTGKEKIGNETNEMYESGQETKASTDSPPDKKTNIQANSADDYSMTDVEEPTGSRTEVVYLQGLHNQAETADVHTTTLQSYKMKDGTRVMNEDSAKVETQSACKCTKEDT